MGPRHRHGHLVHVAFERQVHRPVPDSHGDRSGSVVAGALQHRSQQPIRRPRNQQPFTPVLDPELPESEVGLHSPQPGRSPGRRLISIIAPRSQAVAAKRSISSSGRARRPRWAATSASRHRKITTHRRRRRAWWDRGMTWAPPQRTGPRAAYGSTITRPPHRTNVKAACTGVRDVGHRPRRQPKWTSRAEAAASG